MIKLIIICLVVLIIAGAGFYFLNAQKTVTDEVNFVPGRIDQFVSSPSGKLSDDPSYKEVKEKYNLTEEQLQILSTVNPGDNE